MAVQKVKEASAWLKDYITAIKSHQLHPFTPLERLTREATRDQPWGPTGTLLKDLSERSQDDSSCRIILAVLQARMACPPPKWRNIYKALTVLEYLLKNGSELVVQLTRAEVIFKLEDLEGFEYVSTEGRDQGVNVRLRAQAIGALLRDGDRLQSERAILAQKQRRYQGFSRDQLVPSRTLSEAPSSNGNLTVEPPPALRRTRSAGESEASFAADDSTLSPHAPSNPPPQIGSRGRRNAGETKGITMEENKKHLAALRQLLQRPENKACADCASSSAGGRPTWASINTGAFICMRCAGIHRGLGVHVSKVRSTTLDTWLPEQVEFMDATGNAVANAYREAKLDPAQRPGPDSPDLAGFIRRKYNGEFAEGTWPPPAAFKPTPSVSPAVIRTSSRQGTGVPFEHKSARIIGDNAIESFCHNASQLEAAMRSSGAPVRRMSFDAGDQFSINASFTTACATPAGHRGHPSISETPTSAASLHRSRQAGPPPVQELPDLMAFDDSPHAPQQPQSQLHNTQAPTGQHVTQHGAQLALPQRAMSPLGPIQELELGLHLLDDDLFGSDVANASYMQPLPAGPHVAHGPAGAAHDTRAASELHRQMGREPDPINPLANALSFDNEPLPSWAVDQPAPSRPPHQTYGNGWQPQYLSAHPTSPVDSSDSRMQPVAVSSTRPLPPTSSLNQQHATTPMWTPVAPVPDAPELQSLVQAALKDMQAPAVPDGSFLRNSHVPRPASLTELRKAQSAMKGDSKDAPHQVQVHAVSNSANMNTGTYA